MKKMGVDVTFINQDASVEEINAAFKENTKCMFGPRQPRQSKLGRDPPRA